MPARVKRTRALWSNPFEFQKALDNARRKSSHSRNIWKEMESGHHGIGSVQAKTAKQAYVSSLREWAGLRKIGKRQNLMDQRNAFNIENPKAFEARLFNFLRINQGNNAHFSLAVVDLDFLKKINDAKGHAAGNRALKAVIASLNSIAKKHNGFAASWTRGDEFRIFIPKPANVLAAGLDSERKKLNSKGYQISAGVTDNSIARINNIPQINKKVERMTRQADKAVYSAKRTGRNRIAVFK